MKWKVASKKTDDLIEQLLINRGIINKEVFFSPKLSLYDGDLEIPGIKKAQNRIKKAIEKGEQIVIYGDYDVDGICASAILYKGLASIGAKVLPYIPHREKEGYGLANVGLEFARDSGASLVITVDNGIVAIEQAKYAKSIGLDLIITDHHLPGEKRPEAFEIIHSTKMCGASVAWCLLKGIISKELHTELLQFAAIATVCDLMLLKDLGRAFVVEGLKILRKTSNMGLNFLISESGIEKGELGTYEIGYVLGPRLNAIGRLEHAIDALRLVCTKDQIKAKRLAKLLCQTNTARQQMTQEATDEARLLIDGSKKIHILKSGKWAQGIIGLIAGKITEEFARPAIAIFMGETISKGSARSVSGVNIIEIIRSCSDILINVGGHPGAAGFSIENKHIKIFTERIEKLVADLPDEVEKVLEIDAEVDRDKLSKKLISQLDTFEPFGFGNPRPIFATYNMKASDIKTVGAGKHLKLKVEDPERSEGSLDAIAFGMGQLASSLKTGQLIDLAYNLELNKFNGSEKLQLKIKDIKYKSGQSA